MMCMGRLSGQGNGPTEAIHAQNCFAYANSPTLLNLYDDCLSDTPITAKSANVVIADQHQNQRGNSAPLLA